MSLSTFSFNSRNTVLMTVLLTSSMLLIYHVLIVCQVLPPGLGDTSFKQNVILVENYQQFNQSQQSNRDQLATVALGSSVLNRVAAQDDSPDLVNLCIRGFNAVDGIGVIKRTKKYPRVAL